MGVLGRLRAALGTAPTGAEPRTTGESRAASPPAALENPFAERNRQLLSTLRWLVGVLAAVASVMVAGSQLSTLGQLSPDGDRNRLVAASLSAGIAVALVVVAVGMLAWVQMPGPPVDVPRLRALATEPRRHVTVLRIIGADSSYHRGTGGLVPLLDALQTSAAAYYEAAGRLHIGELTALTAGTERERSVASASAAVAREEVALWEGRLRGFRVGVQASAQLESHLRLQRRARYVTAFVLVIASLVAVCLVVFAWAANPPAEPLAAGSTAALVPSVLVGR